MNDSNDRTPLSPDGENRRIEMLTHLKSEMKSFHDQRYRMRASFYLGSVLLVSVLAVYGSQIEWQSNQNSPDSIAETTVSTPNSNSELKTSAKWLGQIRIVNSRPGAANEYVVSRQSPITEFKMDSIDDQQLLAMLAEVGKPSILGRIDGELRLFPVKENLSN